MFLKTDGSNVKEFVFNCGQNKEQRTKKTVKIIQICSSGNSPMKYNLRSANVVQVARLFLFHVPFCQHLDVQACELDLGSICYSWTALLIRAKHGRVIFLHHHRASAHRSHLTEHSILSSFISGLEINSVSLYGLSDVNDNSAHTFL